MSNNYYTFAPQFIPGTLARAGDVNTQFGLVQAAFDKITSGNATIGVDSGAVNALVITLPTVRTSYTNGDEVVFMPAVQNTGPATINVSGVGVIGLKRFNGSALQSGDLLTGTWYVAKYASASNTYEVIAPAAYTTAAGVVSGAAPVNKVGLVAAGGVSVNVLPIDAAFALDQSIVPTWTGAHIFNGATIGGSAAGTWTGSQAFNGATIGGSAAGTWTGSQAFNGATIGGSAAGTWTGSQAFNGATLTTSGTVLSTNNTASALILRGDIALAAWQNTATTPVLKAGTVKAYLGTGANVTDAAIASVGALNLYSGALATAAVSFDTSGNTNIVGGAVIGAPTGGQKGTGTLNATGIFINNVAIGVAANPTAVVGLAVVNGSATTFLRSDGAPALDQTITPTWTAQHVFTASGGGAASAIYINAATQPGIGFRDAAGAADSKVWDLTSNTTNILGRLINDAASVSRNFLNVTRSGVAVSSIVFGNATDNPLVQAFDQAGGQWDLGWRDIPENAQTTNYTLALSDRGKSVVFTGAAATLTIPANASIAFPRGSTIVIVNSGGAPLSIAITADTLILAGTGSAGARTLASNGVATLIKSGASTQWFISGAGVS